MLKPGIRVSCCAAMLFTCGLTLLFVLKSLGNLANPGNQSWQLPSGAKENWKLRLSLT